MQFLPEHWKSVMLWGMFILTNLLAENEPEIC